MGVRRSGKNQEKGTRNTPSLFVGIARVALLSLSVRKKHAAHPSVVFSLLFVHLHSCFFKQMLLLSLFLLLRSLLLWSWWSSFAKEKQQTTTEKKWQKEKLTLELLVRRTNKLQPHTGNFLLDVRPLQDCCSASSGFFCFLFLRSLRGFVLSALWFFLEFSGRRRQRLAKKRTKKYRQENTKNKTCFSFWHPFFFFFFSFFFSSLSFRELERSVQRENTQKAEVSFSFFFLEIARSRVVGVWTRFFFSFSLLLSVSQSLKTRKTKTLENKKSNMFVSDFHHTLVLVAAPLSFFLFLLSFLFGVCLFSWAGTLKLKINALLFSFFSRKFCFLLTHLC